MNSQTSKLIKITINSRTRREFNELQSEMFYKTIMAHSLIQRAAMWVDAGHSKKAFELIEEGEEMLRLLMIDCSHMEELTK